jgi:LmbE family N-acetylglucosaminyl deacetylase
MTPTHPEHALIVVAHPDDPEFAAGGTIARWTAAGARVTYCIVSDGAKGTSDPGMAPDRLAAVREAEQRAAADVLGVAEIVFLGLPDGEVVPDMALRHAIARQIRRFRPDVVVTHDPATLYTDTYINHPDHRAVGQAALDAVFPTARDPLNAPHLLRDEGLPPHHVGQVHLTGTRTPDAWVDIEPTFARKVEAVRAHVSQIRDPAGLEARLRERAAGLAEGHGMVLAEAFKQIVLP